MTRYIILFAAFMNTVLVMLCAHMGYTYVTTGIGLHPAAGVITVLFGMCMSTLGVWIWFHPIKDDYLDNFHYAPPEVNDITNELTWPAVPKS